MEPKPSEEIFDFANAEVTPTPEPSIPLLAVHFIVHILREENERGRARHQKKEDRFNELFHTPEHWLKETEQKQLASLYKWRYNPVEQARYTAEKMAYFEIKQTLWKIMVLLNEYSGIKPDGMGSAVGYISDEDLRQQLIPLFDHESVPLPQNPE